MIRPLVSLHYFTLTTLSAMPNPSVVDDNIDVLEHFVVLLQL